MSTESHPHATALEAPTNPDTERVEFEFAGRTHEGYAIEHTFTGSYGAPLVLVTVQCPCGRYRVPAEDVSESR